MDWGLNTIGVIRNFSKSMRLATRKRNFTPFIVLKTGDILTDVWSRYNRSKELIRIYEILPEPRFFRKGYVTEAVKALLKFGLENLNLRKIYAACNLRN